MVSEFDILIKNARVIDGTGSPWYRADVGVKGDKVARVGRLKNSTAKLSIEAEDNILAPGFIEIHGHSDRTLLINPLAESSIHLGVTTETVGNCGNSIAPLTSLNFRTENGSFQRIVPDFEISWRSVADLYKEYQKRGSSVNIVPFVGHNTIRAASMGPHIKPANPQDIRNMVKLLREALEAGANGISTGLEYPPGCAASTEELIQLVAVAGEYDGLYSTHIRNRDQRYLEAIDETLNIARETGVPTQVSHNVAKIGAADGVMEQVLQKIENVRLEGVDVTFDVGPYLGGQTTASAALPKWAVEGGVENTLARLSDPGQRKEIMKWKETIWMIIKLGMWDKVRLATSKQNPELISKTFQEIASLRAVEPGDALLDLLLEEGEGLFDLFWEGEIYFAKNRDMVLSHPLSMICCDGRALAPYGPLKQLSYHHIYNWIPYLFRYHVKERGLLSLEKAIHKLTGMSAQRLGLMDRGIIRPGMKADLVIFDPLLIAEKATISDPHRYPVGIKWTIVNGQITLKDAKHTGEKAGKLLLRQQ